MGMARRRRRWVGVWIRRWSKRVVGIVRMRGRRRSAMMARRGWRGMRIVWSRVRMWVGSGVCGVVSGAKRVGGRVWLVVGWPGSLFVRRHIKERRRKRRRKREREREGGGLEGKERAKAERVYPRKEGGRGMMKKTCAGRRNRIRQEGRQRMSSACAMRRRGKKIEHTTTRGERVCVREREREENTE
jgi:hypothetical protein